jgi:ankyrin repeat protein
MRHARPLGCSHYSISNEIRRLACLQEHTYHTHQYDPMNKFEAPNDHPIHDALMNGNVDLVKRCMAEGVDPYLNGVLAGAIHGGHISIMNVMLDYGVDVNKPIKTGGWRPLMRAIEARQMPVIQFLLEKGADINGGLG